jgi:hypothetical protein
MFEWIFGLGFVGILLVAVASIFWIFALIDCLQNPRLHGVEKLVWVLVILFTHLLDAIPGYKLVCVPNTLTLACFFLAFDLQRHLPARTAWGPNPCQSALTKITAKHRWPGQSRKSETTQGPSCLCQTVK